VEKINMQISKNDENNQNVSDDYEIELLNEKLQKCLDNGYSIDIEDPTSELSSHKYSFSGFVVDIDQSNNTVKVVDQEDNYFTVAFKDIDQSSLEDKLKTSNSLSMS